MNNLKYAVIALCLWGHELQITVLTDDISSCLEAEEFRSDYLKKCPKQNPQMIQVLQYAA